ncbi:hypothetical protein PAHAL_5G405500 [Panicum hallii]|jgi:hypothetical protein|uniref:Uncharacterized protein n=1 Tax=Panicum hallii TaxID=206008 RepID=A0A2T8IMS2_9POAL|nr:hypothetical protein PAHAL_5G405500 [Panicum hallii]
MSLWTERCNGQRTTKGMGLGTCLGIRRGRRRTGNRTARAPTRPPLPPGCCLPRAWQRRQPAVVGPTANARLSGAPVRAVRRRWPAGAGAVDLARSDVGAMRYYVTFRAASTATRPGRPRPAVARSVAGAHRRCLSFFPAPHWSLSFFLSFFPGRLRSRPLCADSRAGRWTVTREPAWKQVSDGWPPCMHMRVRARPLSVHWRHVLVGPRRRRLLRPRRELGR